MCSSTQCEPRAREWDEGRGWLFNSKPRPLYLWERTLLALYRKMDGFQGRCGRMCIGENIFVAFKGTKNFTAVLERSWNISSRVLEGLTEKFQVCLMASNL
jgi:hypothetical protein